MTFDHNPIPIHDAAQLLQQISATTGFTPAEIEAMIDCELKTNHLLDYIKAATSNGMN